MGIFDSIKASINETLQRKKEDKEFIRRLDLQAKVEERKIFEEEYKRNALEVAKAKAKKDAAKLSGLQKMRAVNRVRNLERGEQRGGFFEKLAEFSQKNIARREANMERTRLMREQAQQLREERMAKAIALREQRTSRSRSGGFNNYG